VFVPAREFGRMAVAKEVPTEIAVELPILAPQVADR
jgi:hypothetical protein